MHRYVGLVLSRNSLTACVVGPCRLIYLGPARPSPPLYDTSNNPHQAEIDRCFKAIDLSFENTAEAYKSKSSIELLRGLLVLRLSSIQTLVNHNQTLLKLLRKFGGRTIFRGVMKWTFFGHFVAGETKDEITPVVEQMGNFGVKAILDYCVEADISNKEAVEKEMVACEDIEVEGQAPVLDYVDSGRYQAHPEFGDRREGVVSARVYFYEDEKECDANANIFLESIDSVSQATHGTGFCAIKLTALGRPQLLLRLSEVIAQTQQFYKMLTGSSWENLVTSKISKQDFLEKLVEFGVKVDTKAVKDWFSRADFDQDGFIDIYEWGRLLEENIKLGSLFQVVDLKTGSMQPLLANLSVEENQQFVNMMARLKKIAKYATAKDVRVMVDAEQTYFQPAISRLTLELMRRYNKEKPIFFNTYQAYLKNAQINLKLDLHIAQREDFYFGAKLVRGAYMEQERSRADIIGYDDPINPTYESTTHMYSKLVQEILDEYNARGGDKICAMCATHNEESVRKALESMRIRQIGPSQRVICFGQLYGMCDQVSFSLGQAGFSVYKYVPYGPIEEVLPYLSRRALENGSLLSNNAKERNLMAKELKRRWTTGDLWHDPIKHLPQTHSTHSI